MTYERLRDLLIGGTGIRLYIDSAGDTVALVLWNPVVAQGARREDIPVIRASLPLKSGEVDDLLRLGAEDYREFFAA